MKTKWTIDDEQAHLECSPETVTDKAIMEGLGNVTSATVKRNGTLTFIIDLPRQQLSKPTVARPSDEVRDNL